MYAEIILPLPLYSTFTYEIPEEMRHDLCKGSRVLVQFGKKSITLVLWSIFTPWLRQDTM